MNKRLLLASSGLVGAAALGVGIICLMFSSPSPRTITLAPAVSKRTGKIDPSQAKAAFDEQVAGYRKAGEPVRPEEITPPPVEPGKNVVTSLLEAITILDAYDVPAHQTFFNINVRLDMPDSTWKQVDDVISKPLVPMLAKVDEASTRTACVWNIKYNNPIYLTLLPHLNGLRGIANILQPAAFSAHRAGRDDEALRRTAQLLQLARWADQQPFGVTHLVGLGISRMACDTADNIIPKLKIGNHPGDATEAQVKALIADFSDETWAGDALHSALRAERLSIINIATCLETKKITSAEMLKVMPGSNAAPRSEITPGEAYFDALPMLQMFDPLIEVARTSGRLGQFQSKLPPPQAPPPSVMAAVMPRFDDMVVRHFTALARLRMTATALAARLWMAQHNGQPPTALADLAPTCIAALPPDPLAATDDAPFTYKLAPQPTIVGATARPQDHMEVRLTGK